MDINKGNKTYGYCRISTKEQNIERQRDALLQFGVEERDIFIDEKSGKDFNRDSDDFDTLFNISKLISARCGLIEGDIKSSICKGFVQF